MNTLSDEDKDVVTGELEAHIQTFQSLTSEYLGRTWRCCTYPIHYNPSVCRN